MFISFKAFEWRLMIQGKMLNLLKTTPTKKAAEKSNSHFHLSRAFSLQCALNADIKRG